MGLRLFTDHCISNFIIQELLKADLFHRLLEALCPPFSSRSAISARGKVRAFLS